MKPAPSTTAEPRSCLYECSVMHHRLAPRQHRFRYGIFMLCLDLDELPALDARLRTFSHNRWNLYTFRDDDHLQTGGGERGAGNTERGTQNGERGVENQTAFGGLKSELTAWLAEQGVTLPADARITLVTLPRVLGYIFSPVSFYFCHTAQGMPLAAVAEVQNTFGELKPYLVPLETEAGAEKFRVVVPKHFYVSPFSGLDLCFDFRLRTPGDRLELNVNDVTGDGQTQLVSTLTGTRQPLTDGQLLRLTAKYPLVTLRVITLIHWHALRLWWKRISWHRKTAQPDLQSGVYRPHASLRRAPAEAPIISPAPAPVD